MVTVCAHSSLGIQPWLLSEAQCKAKWMLGVTLLPLQLQECGGDSLLSTACSSSGEEARKRMEEYKMFE